MQGKKWIFRCEQLAWECFEREQLDLVWSYKANTVKQFVKNNWTNRNYTVRRVNQPFKDRFIQLELVLALKSAEREKACNTRTSCLKIINEPNESVAQARLLYLEWSGEHIRRRRRTRETLNSIMGYRMQWSCHKTPDLTTVELSESAIDAS